MRVLITGGTGRVGAPVSRRFVELGWDVRVIGVEESCAIEGVAYSQCDILDVDALAEQVKGCDAIAHLAAIPSTLSHPNEALFKINVSGTYNVFEAAARAGVQRIAQASSINALGGYWGCDDRQFDYFPLDEAHPTHTTDAYSFSKQLVEEIAAYYHRRKGISSVSFRFPAVWSEEALAQGNLRESLPGRRRRLDEFRQLPRQEREARMQEARSGVLDMRARHIMEHEQARTGQFDREAQDDWLFHAYFFDRFNYWTFIHTDDSTQAFEKALTVDFEGAHPLFVNSDRNYLGYDSAALLALFFPDVRERSRPLAGADSLVSIERVSQLIGFAPTVSSLD